MRPLFVLTLLASLVGAQEVKRPRITGVAHVALFVADVGKARVFYKDFLGYGEPFELRNPDGSLSLTFFKINDRQYLEIFPEREAGSDRLNHVSLETDDAQGMRDYLASKGVPVPEKPAKGRIGNLNFNVTDPDGHVLEFVQYMPGSFTLREKGNYLGPERISDHMAHFGILVGALEPAMKFYRDILGLQEIWRGSSDGKQLSWVNMKVPDGDDYIEFMLHQGQVPTARLRSAHHICLFVPDMGKAVAALETHPARKTYTQPIEPRIGTNRRRLLNLYDPDGTRVELMEPQTVDGMPTPSSTAPPPQ